MFPMLLKTLLESLSPDSFPLLLCCSLSETDVG